MHVQIYVAELKEYFKPSKVVSDKGDAHNWGVLCIVESYFIEMI